MGKYVKKHQLNLIAFDDLEKKHYADIIINAKIQQSMKDSFTKKILKICLNY